MPHQGSRRAAGLLRLPRRALGSPAHDQSHRERVRDHAAQNRADERITVVNDRQADGIQAGRRRIENLAAAQRHKSVAEGDCRCQNSTTASRSSTCRQTTPPDRLVTQKPRIAQSVCAPAFACALSRPSRRLAFVGASEPALARTLFMIGASRAQVIGSTACRTKLPW